MKKNILMVGNLLILPLSDMIVYRKSKKHFLNQKTGFDRYDQNLFAFFSLFFLGISSRKFCLTTILHFV